MATAAGRRVDQDKPDQVVAPTYDMSFLAALEPALDDLAKHGIKVAVNAGVTDTKGLYEAVMKMIHSKGLDLKVCSICWLNTWSYLMCTVGGLGIWR